MEILQQLPVPRLGEHVAAMGNTGEGKTVTMISLLNSRDIPNYIIVNTKHDETFGQFGETITDDDKILTVTTGCYDYRPSDTWMQSMPYKDRFFAQQLRQGNRAVYIDEVNDICPSAQMYPYQFQKAIKQGRWKFLTMMISGQEIIRAPSFSFSQARYRYVYYIGWPTQRRIAEAWFEQDIPWEEIPEYSHKFILKTPSGVYGPQPPVDISSIQERLITTNA